jgi:xylan 1,4-beta-xylosidase
VTVEVSGLGAGAYLLRHYRIDVAHSNVAAVWERMRGEDPWPDEDGWRALHAANRLEELHPPRPVEVADGGVLAEFDLPMPSVSLLELVPD